MVEYDQSYPDECSNVDRPKNSDEPRIVTGGTSQRMCPEKCKEGISHL